MKVTIHTIKADYQANNPEGHFFDRDSMKFFGQTLKSFKVRKLDDSRFHISAPMRDRSGQHMGTSERVYDFTTHKLELVK